MAMIRQLTFRNLSKITGILGCRNMSSNQLVDVQTDSKTGISTVTMNRPPVNSLSLELLTELRDTFINLEKNKCRGMVLTSASPTVFSSGLDILEMYQPKQDRVKEWWSTLQDMWLALYGSSYATAAAINGHSPAGGCLIACSCEYRVMVQGKFTIGLNESKLGIAVPKWFIDSFRAVVPNRISEMALTAGKLFTVDEALKVGLIDEVANDKDDAVVKANKFLANFANIAPMARTTTKMLLRNDALEWMRQNKEKDLNNFLMFVNMPLVQKGLEAYLQSLKKK